MLPHYFDGIAWAVVRSDCVGAMPEDSHGEGLGATRVSEFVLNSVVDRMPRKLMVCDIFITNKCCR